MKLYITTGEIYYVGN